MVATGFTNSFTSGEISEDAWDRTELQPVAKGCEEATNLVIRVTGPLSKRRAFWRLGPVANENQLGRLIGFRRSVNDAVMLEFGNLVCRVWSPDGSPLLNAGVQVSFATPWTSAQLDGLRWKQIGDVVYFRHRDGLRPKVLRRASNISWSIVDMDYPNGPWLPENKTGVVITAAGGSANYLQPGDNITLTSSGPVFQPGQVGGHWRFKQNTGQPGISSWAPETDYNPNQPVLSNGRIYTMASALAAKSSNTPPIHDSGTVSDGRLLWQFRSDGAGVVLITGYTSATQVSATVIAGFPFGAGEGSPVWAEGAYSDYRGWPRMWPALREERLIEGSTAMNADQLDLSSTAGFDPASANFRPGLGTGAILDTDAIRRRIGDDSTPLVWAAVSTYLLVGSQSGEYLVAGSVLDEPLSPAAVTVKDLTSYGSAETAPERVHNGLVVIAHGGSGLFELVLDTQQGFQDEDLTVLAQHLAVRGFAELAWVKKPDEVLWARLADGGLAAMTYHKKQAVRGFTRQALPPGWSVESLAVIPGPNKLDTLWMIVTRVKAGVRQRVLVQQSETTDVLFMDLAEYYAGPPVTTVGGLGHFEGETVRILADGVQLPDQVVTGAQIKLSTPAAVVYVGQAMLTRFKSLKLDLSHDGHQLSLKQRIVGVLVSLKTALCRVGMAGGGPLETVSSRTADNVPGATAQRVIKEVTVTGDTSRDPRLLIEDDSAYDLIIYSLKPKVAING